MEKITLGQLAQYFKEDGEDIQVCFEDQEWDNYEQVSMESRLLKPYMNYVIKCMGIEKAFDTKNDVLRVMIGKKEEEKQCVECELSEQEKMNGGCQLCRAR